MPPFRDIGDATVRKIDRKMMGLSGIDTLEDLEARFLQEAGTILPGDCLCWNNWTLDLGSLIDFRISDCYTESFSSLLDVFGEVVAHHPVIAADLLGKTTETVMRLSDFESGRQFRENPLFREVYRHLDSHHQLAYTPCLLEDRRIVLTWNRLALDFSERDRQIFQFMGLRLAVICRRIEQRLKLEKGWRALCGFVDARLGTGSASDLGAKDVILLDGILRSNSRSDIARHTGVRRDSVDKRLGSIRERLGLENHHQLLSALAELKNPPEES